MAIWCSLISPPGIGVHDAGFGPATYLAAGVALAGRPVTAARVCLRVSRPGGQNTRIGISAGSASRSEISSSSRTSVTEAPAMSSEVQYSPT